MRWGYHYYDEFPFSAVAVDRGVALDALALVAVFAFDEIRLFRPSGDASASALCESYTLDLTLALAAVAVVRAVVTPAP